MRARGLTGWAVALAIVGGSTLALGGGAGADTVVDREAPGAPLITSIRPRGQTDPIVTFVRSTDDTGIRAYEVRINGMPVEVVDDASTRSSEPNDFSRRIRLDPLAEGVWWVQLVAIDLAGNRSVRSSPVRFEIDDTPPSAPQIVGQRVTAQPGGPQVQILYTVRDLDDIEGCRLLRNLDATFFTLPDTPRPSGDGETFVATDAAGWYVEDFLSGRVWWYQVECSDDFGNRSARSSPERVDLTAVP